MNNIVVLGSTGSIGTQTLEIVRNYPEDLKVCALAAGSNVELMEKQVREFLPSKVVMWSKSAAEDLKVKLADLQVEVLVGMDGLLDIVTMESDRQLRQLKAEKPSPLLIKKLWLRQDILLCRSQKKKA